MLDETGIRALEKVAMWLNGLVLFGVTTFATIIILRFQGKKTVNIAGIELSLGKTPHFAGALTCAHLFLTWMFSQQIDGLKKLPVGDQTKAWKHLTSDSFLFYGMKQRVQQNLGWSAPYRAEFNDTAFWATVVFDLCLLVACSCALWPDQNMGSRKTKMEAGFNAVAVSIILALLNWVIGSHWAIKASSLLLGDKA